MSQILLSAHRLEKAFGSRTLFKNLTFAIQSGDRIGLIGPNGAGKSTLLKIIAGKLDRDGGELSKSRGTVIGLLDQSPQFGDEETVYDAVFSGLRDPESVEGWGIVDEILSRLNLQGSVAGPEAAQGVAQGVAQGADQSAVQGSTVTPQHLVRELSGGWRKRVALARELARQPDLLLLDEPTNHLDVEGIRWLEDFLASSAMATLTITHDRLFLQRVANRVFDLDPRYPDGLLVSDGDYATYVEKRQELIRTQEQREVVLKNSLRRETEWLRRGAKARTTKQNARIERAGDLKDEVEDLGERNLQKRLRVDFQEAERNPQRLIMAEGIGKSTPDGRVLFENLDLLMTPKTRLGLLGANGCGKSTLIRCLLGLDEVDTGKVRRAERIEAAYFEQNRDTLDPQKSVLRNICDEGDYVEFRGQPVYARSYLDRFLFRTEQHDMPVAKLSGGEQARLRVAQMMLRPSNVLVLDEPTNDLDMATLVVLEEVLRDFKGAVILVTHDRYFLDQVSNKILAFDREFYGQPLLQEFSDFAQWESWWEAHQRELRAQQRAHEKQVASSAAAAAAAANGADAKKRRMSFKEKHELETIETTIKTAEKELARLQADSVDSQNLRDAKKMKEILSAIEKQQTKIEKLFSRWSELEEMAKQ
jgi:ATP-binding cassette subfamily F protein uup